MTIRRLLSNLVLLFPLVLWTAPAVVGQAEGGQLMCPAPVMVCSNTAGTPDGCPPGHDCTCVPSCPFCRDCAARVCVVSAKPGCRTACDCEPGLGCFDNKCIAGFAPVFCCEGDQCPAGEQCQHRDGRMDRCRGGEPACTDQAWLCNAAGNQRGCGNGRVCACSASCPSCEDCGPQVCVPPNLGVNPYRCNDDGGCDRAGDRCICVPSCPLCTDCALNLCVPACESQNDRCEERLQIAERAIHKIVDRSRRCTRDEDCRRIDTNTECRGTCGAFVNRMRAPLIARAVRYIDHKVCSMYQDDDCPYATPRCVAQAAACVEGLCTGRTPVDATTD